MRRALIGHSGFVGSNLNRQQSFTDRYNSRNFTSMRGETYDEIVCAGVQAVKWWANQNPQEDWAGIAPLLDVLDTVTVKRFVLISTVDVYASPVGVDENTPISEAGLHPYGLHRRKVEQWVRKNTGEHTIVRLPGLYGDGLKKNLIFDLLTHKSIDGFDARSAFQFYSLARLGSDLEKAAELRLETINLAVEPVDVASIVVTLTGSQYDNRLGAEPLRYDMRTIYADAWGHNGGYLETAAESLLAIQTFAKNWRPAAAQ